MHLIISGYTQQRFYCNKCGKSYKRKKNLRCHILHECGKDPQYQCHICNKKYHLKWNLNTHMKLSHLVRNSSNVD